MRLIDADALVKEAGKLWAEMPDGEELSKELMKSINHAPIVDAVPNPDGRWLVHGRWEQSDYNGYCRCSVCLDCYIDKTWTIGGNWRYCPTCGAKMDGGEANANGT